MAGNAINLGAAPVGKRFIAYKDPSGGLNTKRDAHALDRNMLAMSVNMWPAYDNALSKRPGSNFAISSNGATGSGVDGTTIVDTRWNVSGISTTVLLAQNGTKLSFAAIGASSWTQITTTMGTGAQRIHVAQMYDPTSAANVCFICNGVDLPWIWEGPGNTTMTQTSVANGLPVNQGGSTGITPRFVETFNGSLIYAGEPTSPTAVYISDSWYPQHFTQSASSATNYPGSYQPYLIGYNDGVNGGNVTGLGALQGSIIVVKESSIYRGTFSNIYGAIYAFVWQCISASRGFIAPESIVAFETYICGLSIDGCYYTDGYQMVQFSADVPTFFDGSLTGYAPLCVQYPSAVAVRSGQRYLIWYDRGTPSDPGAAAGYCTSGLWFDFSKSTASGMPQAGEMQGTTSADGQTWAIAGACALAGPYDTGLFAWTDPTRDRVAIFGLGFADLGGNIACVLAGPADMMPEAANPDQNAAGISAKTAHRAFLNIAVPLGQMYSFDVSIITDLLTVTQTVNNSINAISVGMLWGTGLWGTGLWGAASNATSYQPLGFCPSQSADGNIIQLMLSESSTNGWILLGYELEVSARMPIL
jgi:hypothetical protein